MNQSAMKKRDRILELLERQTKALEEIAKALKDVALTLNTWNDYVERWGFPVAVEKKKPKRREKTEDGE